MYIYFIHSNNIEDNLKNLSKFTPRLLQSATTLKMYNAKHLQVFNIRIMMF